MLAFILLWPLVFVATSIPWWSSFTMPIFGIAGAGVFDKLERESIGPAIDRLTTTLTQPSRDEIEGRHA